MKYLFFIFLLLYSFTATAISLSGVPMLGHPIVLVHGSSMSGAQLKLGPLPLGEYFQNIPEFLHATGTPVAVVNLDTNATIAEQAEQLQKFLAEKFPEEKVHLLCHSMGGLVARYLASSLHSQQIISIIMIATPNQGTPVADWAAQQIQQPGFWYWVLRAFSYDLKKRRFIPELTTAGMRKFNMDVIDRPDIRYFSVISTSRPGQGMNPLLYFPYLIVGQPSDGIVPEASQAWGTVIEHETFDHLAEINHYSFINEAQDEVLLLYRQIYLLLLNVN